MLETRLGVPQETFPFFLGAGRSGTTLLRAMFDTHPEMAIPSESGFIVRLARERKHYERADGFEVSAFTTDLLEHFRFRRWDLSRDEVHEALPPEVADYSEAIRRLYHFYALREGKPRYGDKTPSYVMRLPLLAELFPEARFVHIIRDGRDIALSHLDIEGWGPRSLDEAAVQWTRQVSQGMLDGATLGRDRYQEVRYEDLIADPEGTLLQLCGFVSLPYEPAMLRYFDRATKLAGETPHFRNLYRPPTTGLRDWRKQMSKEDLVRFEALAGGLLNHLGYEIEANNGSTPRFVTLFRRVRVRVQGLRVRNDRLRRRARRRIGRASDAARSPRGSQ